MPFGCRHQAYVRKAKPTPEDMARAAHAIADAAGPKFAAMVQRRLDTLMTERQLDALVGAIRDHNLAQVSQMLPTYPRGELWQPLADEYDRAYRAIIERSGKAEIDRMGFPMRFNLDNPYTSRWIETMTAQRVKEISADTQASIRGVIRSGWIDGVHPTQMADVIRPLLGLTTAQAEQVGRHRAGLLAQGLASDRAAAQTAQFAAALLQRRAETVARTETIAAEAQGLQDSWLDARAQDVIAPGARREWIASSEENGACPICTDLDAQLVELDEPFTSSLLPDGQIDRPPAHPNCRCTMGLRDMELE